MKLVASKDFFNSKRLGITVSGADKHFRHESHVHKGYRFSIGTTEIYKDFGAQDQEDVGTLLKHGCAVMDNDENKHVIAKIDAEAKAEFAAHKLSSVPPPTLAELIVNSLIEAGVITPKKAA